jgi:asparagine synthetase B (glutamine-hydrolysing)
MHKSAEQGHGSLQERLFRLQFILGPGVPAGYESWQHSVVANRLQLLAHPSLTVNTAEGEGLSLTLLGYILDPQHPQASDSDILASITAQVSRGDDLATTIEPLGGRWVLIVSDQQGLRLFNDAAGSRQVFHATGDSGELWCASQPDHIAGALGLEKSQEALRFIHWFAAQNREYWWPGTSSHYGEIARLLPNHYLDLATGRAHRFWPRSELRTCRVDEALSSISALSTGMMQAAAHRFDLAIALSAGWDSRLLLAASRPVAQQVQYYTAKRPDMGWRHMDVDVPVRLARQLGLRHQVVEHGTEVTPEFERLFDACSIRVVRADYITG